MTKIPHKLHSLFKLSLVFSFAGLSFFIIPTLIHSHAYAASGTVYVVTSQRDSNNTLTDTLNSIDLTTGAATQIGDPLESVLPGGNNVEALATYDPVGHRYLYWDDNNSQTGYIVIQDTQTGVITTVTNPILHGADNMAYDTSTNTLYVVTSQRDSNNTLTDTLNSIDLTTGAATQIGDPLESVLPGNNNVEALASFDPAGHRYLYWDENSGVGYIVIQDTQTGVITTVTDPILNRADNMAYDTSTNTLYVVINQFNSANNTFSNTLYSVDLTTGADTQIGDPLESVLPGNNNVEALASFDPAGHRYLYWDENSGVGYIVIQNTQTGAITTVTDPILHGADNMAYELSSPPSISNISNATINKGSTYSANGSFTDSSSSSWTATVDYGAGSGNNPLTLNGMNFNLNHIYNSLGTFTVTVRITGDSGLTGTATALITVIPSNGLAGANLGHTNYSGADFANQNLSKANMTVATFNNVDFISANLSQANGSNSSFTNDNFTGANLNKINFSNTDLTGSNFTNAVVTQGNLSNANLTNVNFAGANLTGATLSGATLTGVTWLNTTCPDGTNSNNNLNTCVGHF